MSKRVVAWPISLLMLLMIQINPMLWGQENRSIDGRSNNLTFADWGAAKTRVQRVVSNGYTNFVFTPAGEDRPNPRFISNALFAQTETTPDPRDLSAFAWAFGQFIDHDITLSPDGTGEPMHIEVPAFDAFFDPSGTGKAIIPMMRSAYDISSGIGYSNPRNHLNHITAFIDGSAVYGSDLERASWLRTYQGGQLKTSTGDLLPFNTLDGEFEGEIDPLAPEMAMPFEHIKKMFVAGDVRANENPLLSALHLVFLREHNRLVAELAVEFPEWTDEELYQRARKYIGGFMQAIVFEEWLPILGIEITAYEGYNPKVNPQIMNVFNTAAYRYGHSTINTFMVRMDEAGKELPGGTVPLRGMFFNPEITLSSGGIEPFLMGMSTVVEEDFDCKVVDELRNFLFARPGQGGLDLVALNINRGRDRGLPDYNTIRSDFGLKKFTRFSEITSDPQMSLALENVYHSINRIDPWVGMLAEEHMDDALFGETAMHIIKEQFEALRDGDRYYYENDPALNAEQKLWIKNTRLADLIQRNTGLTHIHDDIFRVQNLTTSTRYTKPEYQKDFRLFPNPVRDVVQLEFENEGENEALVTITGVDGKVLAQHEFANLAGEQKLTIRLDPKIPEGIYLLNLVIGEKVGIKQFTKVKK